MARTDGLFLLCLAGLDGDGLDKLGLSESLERLHRKPSADVFTHTRKMSIVSKDQTWQAGARLLRT